MKILLIDDEPMLRKTIANFLGKQLGHEVVTCESAKKGLRIFKDNPFPLVISDIKMPGISGIELTSRIKKDDLSDFTDIILITGHANLETAISALRAGAYDFIQKPLDIEHLAIVIEKIEKHQAIKRENRELNKNFDQRIDNECKLIKQKLKSLQNAYANVVGVGKIGIFSNVMKRIVEVAEKLHQDPDISVLIQGETGTGKDVIAKLIHYGKGDVEGPFIGINCSAVTESLFESELFGYEGGAFTGSGSKGKIGKMELAQNGTLFLDEIGDMPLSMQPKLLKALQDREIYRVGGVKKIQLNERFICATNSDLNEKIRKNRFRSDLFYRISTTNIYIPPLRERKNEIIPLAQMFLEDFSKRKKQPLQFLSDSAAKLLKKYDWPGNVRQLQNTVERVAFLYNDTNLKADYFEFLFDENDEISTKEKKWTIEFELSKEEFNIYEAEEKIARKALKFNKNNKTKTARYLGISINKLRRILGEM